MQGTEVSQLSGVFPYTRGVRASMYTAKPWTIRQVGVSVDNGVPTQLRCCPQLLDYVPL